jgi:hypothetical protein
VGPVLLLAVAHAQLAVLPRTPAQTAAEKGHISQRPKKVTSVSSSNSRDGGGGRERARTRRGRRWRVAAATWRRNTELGAGGGRATGSTGLAGLFAAGIVGSPAAAGVSGSEGVFSGACPVGRVRRWMDSTFLVMSHPMLFPFLSFFFLLARLRRSFTDVLISRGDPPICPVHEGKFGPALTEAALQPTRFQAHETQDAARLQAILPLEVAIRARQDD